MSVYLRKDDHLHTVELKDKILFQVINAQRNRMLLEQVPHERCLDLALVFYYIGEWENGRKKVFLFNNTQMGEYNVDKGELREWAMKNTPRLLPVSFHSMTDLLRGFQASSPSAGDIQQICTGQVPMYVLTNVKMFLGAACLFYPQVLSSIGNAVQSDFFILPSSIHECIILPVSETYTRQGLEKIVYEVNITQVPEQEILSDHVYFYQNSTGKISK